MRRVYIVVEGQTEQEFVNTVISPYLQEFGVFNITPVLIRTSRNGRGGMVNYQHLWNTVKSLLGSSRNDFVVTTFIDFFRIPNTMPRYEECMAKASKIERVKALESAMNEQSEIDVSFLISSYMNLRLFCSLIIMVLSTTSQKNVLKKQIILFPRMKIRKI